MGSMVSESFYVKMVLRQGCVMSPWLFNLFFLFDPSSDLNFFTSEDVESHYISLKLFWELTLLLKCSCSKKQQYHCGEDSNTGPPINS